GCDGFAAGSIRGHPCIRRDCWHGPGHSYLYRRGGGLARLSVTHTDPSTGCPAYIAYLVNLGRMASAGRIRGRTISWSLSLVLGGYSHDCSFTIRRHSVLGSAQNWQYLAQRHDTHALERSYQWRVHLCDTKSHCQHMDCGEWY